jgi:group I intron endonuclease
MSKTQPKSGIYTITCLVNNKVYVGQSINIKQRLTKHKQKLLTNKHPNIYLQSSVNKYGIDKFSFEELILCDESLLCSEEHYWVTILNSLNREFGFNIDNTSPINFRVARSAETKDKLRRANLGKKHSEETKEKCRVSSTGRIMSEELKLKMSLERKGKTTTGDKRIPITQYDKNNNFIREWTSASEASKALGCIASEISMVCRQYAGISNSKKGIIRKTAGGFIWKYKQN